MTVELVDAKIAEAITKEDLGDSKNGAFMLQDKYNTSVVVKAMLKVRVDLL